MSVSENDWENAKTTGVLVSRKLKEIMDLQADIDALLRDKHPTPFGSQKWDYACIEALQRIVAMTAIQFVLFEPEGRVTGDADFKVAADKLLSIMIEQLRSLKTKKSDW